MNERLPKVPRLAKEPLPDPDALGESLFARYLPPARRGGPSYSVDLRRLPGGGLTAFLTETTVLGGGHRTQAVEIEARFLSAVCGLLEQVRQVAESADPEGEGVAGVEREELKAVLKAAGKGKEEKRDPLARMGEKWTVEEENFVLDETAGGTPIKELAAQLMRKPGAIRSRLKKLGILEVEDRQAAARALLAERQA